MTLRMILLSMFLMGCSTLSLRAPGSVTDKMKYSKISGTYLNFLTGQRISTGVSYSSQEYRQAQHEVVITTYENSKVIETRLILSGPDYLEFSSQSDDARIPIITGRFFNSEFEDCILKSSLPEKKIEISGVVTKIDLNHALSTKTLSDSSGKTVGVMQEQVELISEADFKTAVSSR